MKRKSKDREESSSASQSLDFEGSAVPGFSGATVSVQPSVSDGKPLESSGVGAKTKVRRDRSRSRQPKPEPVYSDEEKQKMAALAADFSVLAFQKRY